MEWISPARSGIVRNIRKIEVLMEKRIRRREKMECENIFSCMKRTIENMAD